MLTSLRVALVAGGLAISAQLLASTDLTLVRGGVGVFGYPQQLSGVLDVNGNGRPELLVAGRWHVSIVEEDASLRGYQEIIRIDAPRLSEFVGAMLVDVPGAERSLLLRWSNRLELRNAKTLDVKATVTGEFGFNGSSGLGDVDGDGVPEIVIATEYTVDLFDPATLESRGNLPLSTRMFAIADIVGDERTEIISDTGSAYTVTRSGANLSLTEVWNAGITGTWNPYVIDLDGHSAIVLVNPSGSSAQLATFLPEPILRTFYSSVEGGFRPVFADANGDGCVDLILASTRVVRAIDIGSGLTLWERDTIYPAPSIGSVYGPVAIDLDGDGTKELTWANASYNSGVVAVSLPLTGLPRWRSDFNQSRVTDWTMVRRAGGTPSIAYLTNATQELPGLGTLGFLDGSRFADQAGSAFSWLPGYDGFSGFSQMVQYAITALPLNELEDRVVVAGAEYGLLGADPLVRWLWTFDSNGALLNARALMSSINPQRITAAQVLDRPERQLIVAGRKDGAGPGPRTDFVRVEILDYATGNVLWQSVPLPTSEYALVTKLEVADLDGDGQPEIVVAYGKSVAILKPSTNSNVAAEYAAWGFSLLDQGIGHNAKFATINFTNASVYDGLSTVPEKTFVLPAHASGIALFTQAPDNVLMLATSDEGTTVRRYADGEIVAYGPKMCAGSFATMDIDGDHRIEIVGSNLDVCRLDNDYIFHDGFEENTQ